MAEFSAAVYQNEFLPDGGTDVNAIVTVTCHGAGTAGQTGAAVAGEIIIIDTSASMADGNMDAAKQAAIAALNEIVDGTYFSVISGNGAAFLAYPPVRSGPGMAVMDPTTRMHATQAITQLGAAGGTVISTWIDLAVMLFASVPVVTQRHAILLTDGENNDHPGVLEQSIARATGVFQCDCRGVGVDWKVDEIRKISSALLGTVGIIPAPQDLKAEFEALMRQAMGRGVSEAWLRVWAPIGAQVQFVKQVSPTVEDLTARRVAVNDLTGDYPTGAWGDESRDYHVSVRLPAKALGQEQLASRVSVVVGGQPVTQGLVKAKWSNDAALTATIDQQVAHYTGQAELAQMIQEGLAAKALGDETTATTKLGRAVQLAAQTGNAEATDKLAKVVEVHDVETGTVRLRPQSSKADEMDLDTSSTKTTRVRGS